MMITNDWILKIANVTFSSCTFWDNNAAAICAFQTNVIFRRNNTFPNNSGGSGAGLTLFMNSYMYLKHSTNQLFVNNQALSVGGAVYADLTLELPGLTLPCFFCQLERSKKSMKLIPNKV